MFEITFKNCLINSIIKIKILHAFIGCIDLICMYLHLYLFYIFFYFTRLLLNVIDLWLFQCFNNIFVVLKVLLFCLFNLKCFFFFCKFLWCPFVLGSCPALTRHIKEDCDHIVFLKGKKECALFSCVFIICKVWNKLISLYIYFLNSWWIVLDLYPSMFESFHLIYCLFIKSLIACISLQSSATF